jgi:hypothetical protein
MMAWSAPRTWVFEEHTFADLMNPNLRDQLNALWVWATKGDLAVYNGSALARLPVGTDGQVLLADSGEATGLRWGTNTGISLGNSHAHTGGYGGTIDHTNLANKGTNTHAQVDTHVGDASGHLSNGNSHRHTGGSDGAQVSHTSLNDVGTNTHAQIDTHLAQPHIPVGAIILYYGLLSAVPSGWHMCDGTYGTPDMRGKFVVGAGGTYSVGATGGGAVLAHTHTSGLLSSLANVHTHVAGPTAAAVHSHAVGATDSAGHHGHTVSGFASGPSQIPYIDNLKSGDTHVPDAYHRHGAADVETSYALYEHIHTLALSGDGSHTHTITLNNNAWAHGHTSPTIGSGLTSTSYPPYMALYYIRRIT